MQVVSAYLERFQGIISNVALWSGQGSVISKGSKCAEHHVQELQNWFFFGV
jgi:hypothetical protein